MEVRTYYLEMTSLGDLRPSRRNIPELNVRPVTPASPELNRFLYQAVGFDWHWIDRLGWTIDDWRNWAGHDDLETWAGWFDGALAGYFELELQDNRAVEISSFGLLGGFTARGIGGPFLTEAVRKAWATNTERVWLHTCTLDHPHALDNYKARGFTVFREETHEQDIVT